MTGRCAKAYVRCTIVTPDGHRFVGTNDVRNPQRVCPRGPESSRNSYSLCRDVCAQYGHAEEMAIKEAGLWAVGATAFVEHWRCCPNCEAALQRAGIREIVLGKPPE